MNRALIACNSVYEAWMLVHTVTDLVEGLRAHVGTCGNLDGTIKVDTDDVGMGIWRPF